MKYTVAVVVVLSMLGASALADFPTVQISIGVRDNGTAAPIGGNGGGSGEIEWVNLDAQTLVLDGTWQQFTFTFASDPITGFTGNGVLDNASGTLEHIRIKSTGFGGPMSMWVDDIADTITVVAPPPPHQVTTTFGTFEGYPDLTEVIFQEPSFSGSTSGFIQPGSFSGVDNTVFHSGAASDHISFQFIDSSTDDWCRLTTFNAPNLPNPALRFDQASVLTFWMMGVPEPASLLLLGLAAGLLRRR